MSVYRIYILNLQVMQNHIPQTTPYTYGRQVQRWKEREQGRRGETKNKGKAQG